jgi:hypothetical protein
MLLPYPRSNLTEIAASPSEEARSVINPPCLGLLAMTVNLRKLRPDLRTSCTRLPYLTPPRPTRFVRFYPRPSARG